MVLEIQSTRFSGPYRLIYGYVNWYNIKFPVDGVMIRSFGSFSAPHSCSDVDDK